jgi:hypothetical protein
MSALGQQRRFGPARVMPGLAAEADVSPVSVRDRAMAHGELVGRRYAGRSEVNARRKCVLRDRRSILAITHQRTCYRHWTVLRLQNLRRSEWGPRSQNEHGLEGGCHPWGGGAQRLIRRSKKPRQGGWRGRVALYSGATGSSRRAKSVVRQGHVVCAQVCGRRCRQLHQRKAPPWRRRGQNEMPRFWDVRSGGARRRETREEPGHRAGHAR